MKSDMLSEERLNKEIGMIVAICHVKLNLIPR